MLTALESAKESYELLDGTAESKSIFFLKLGGGNVPQNPCKTLAKFRAKLLALSACAIGFIYGARLCIANLVALTIVVKPTIVMHR